MQSVSMLTTECCLIIFLNSSCSNGPGPSSSQILIHAIISYVVFWKLQFTKTIHTESENWNKYQQQHQWRTLAAVMWNFVSCWWSQTLLVHISKMFVHDCQSSKTTELRDTEGDGVCYVVRKLYAVKTGAFFLDRPHIICCRLRGKSSNSVNYKV